MSRDRAGSVVKETVAKRRRVLLGLPFVDGSVTPTEHRSVGMSLKEHTSPLRVSLFSPVHPSRPSVHLQPGLPHRTVI